MIIREYTIESEDGLHARPATSLLKLAKKFKSSFLLKKADKQINLNSLLNILALTLKKGDVIHIHIDGEDETEASAAVDAFFLEQNRGI
jgi:phosphocarrier protein HPr